MPRVLLVPSVKTLPRDGSAAPLMPAQVVVRGSPCGVCGTQHTQPALKGRASNEWCLRVQVNTLSRRGRCGATHATRHRGAGHSTPAHGVGRSWSRSYTIGGRSDHSPTRHDLPSALARQIARFN